MIVKRNPDANKYISKLNPKIQEIAKEIRSVVFEAVPDFEEKIHKLHLTYCKNGEVCNIAGYTNHVNLGFFKGAYLKDSRNLLKGIGKNERHIEIKSIKEARNNDIIALIRQSVVNPLSHFFSTVKDVLVQGGVKPGQNVLDFGAGNGNYTIPATDIVGKSGKIYALDMNRKRLDKIMAKAGAISNIQRIDTNGEPNIPLSEDSVDIILLFDVTLKNPGSFLKEFQRVLVSRGHLLIYLPIEDNRTEQTVEKFISNVERAGFIPDRKIKIGQHMVHSDWREQGIVYVFKNSNFNSSGTHLPAAHWGEPRLRRDRQAGSTAPLP